MLRKLASIGAILTAHAFAQPQPSQSPPGWPCTGGRAVDPTYVQLAEETGGEVFLFDRSEAGRSLVLMSEGMKHKETVFRTMGTLAPGHRNFQFPVDTAIESLLFSISVQCPQSVAIYRPSGTQLDATAPGVEDNRFRSGRIVVMSRPEPGIWQIRIAGSGLFFAVVEAKTDFSLHRVEFVQAGGRPGHEGYFTMTTPVRLNLPQVLSATVAGSGVTGFRMIGSAGETIQQVELAANESGDDREFQGTVTPVKNAFRILVEGRDSRGYAYQRIFPRLFHAEP